MSNAFSTVEARDMAFDPAVRPELYDGVRTRRIFAVLIDATVIFFLMLLASLVIGVLGLFTLGLGWFLMPLVWPFVAILYTAFTLGGRHSATPGMRFADLEMRTFTGAPMYSLLALVHAVGFWASVTMLTPLVLLVSLFSPRKRLLHDMLLGTTVIRSDR